ncbi:hypothetical protein DFQ29_006751 [Apophysomyces sp. BC1021]|nr:hypothetical protein DFQ29_006751 [Apophysomyces sp. BC1021]
MGVHYSKPKRKQQKAPSHSPPQQRQQCKPQVPEPASSPQQKPIFRDQTLEDEDGQVDTFIDDYSKYTPAKLLPSCTRSISDILPIYFPSTFPPRLGSTRFSSCSSSATAISSSAVSLTSALFSIDSSTAPSSISSVSFQSKHSLLPTHEPLTTSRILSEEAKQKIYAALVSDADATDDLGLRLKVAQCKIQGFGAPVDLDGGFSELFHLAGQMTATDFVQISYFLGFCYYTGKTPSGKNEPAELVANAQYLAATLIANGKINGNISTAVGLFEKAANNGHVISQHVMGWHAEQQGDLVARGWYHHAAQQNYASAQADLGDWLLRHHADSKEHVDEALFWLHRAAEQNNAKAHLLLACLYGEGKLVDRDYRQAKQHYDCITIDPNSPHHATIHYTTAIAFRNGDHGLSQDFERAVQHLTIATKANYAPAQRTLGSMYYKGLGVPKDMNRANELFQQAAAQHDARALGFLGEMHQYGYGCLVNIPAALDYYEKAALNGDIVGGLSKALLLHRTGRRVEARQWFERVIQCDTPSSEFDFIQSYQKARLMIALYRFHGWGDFASEPLRAFQDLIALSQEGFAEAFFWVGSGYDEGIVCQGLTQVAPNPTLAFEYLEKASQQGISVAQYKAATMLSSGKATGRKDFTKAFVWYKEAANQGHRKAQYSVGLYYSKGITPVKINHKEAEKWFRASLTNDDDTATTMSDAMVSLGQLLIEREYLEALKYLTKAAQLGNPAGLRELAAIYEKQGGNERLAIAFELLSRATKQKDAKSWVAMARYHENGWSVPQSTEQALVCLAEAEKLNYAKASIAVAELLERQANWNGALQKYDEIAKKHQLLTQAGWLARLGKCRLIIYRNKGSDEDMIQARRWLQEMEQQDVKEALIEPLTMLGICCEATTNTTHEEAIHLYKKAVQQTTSSTHWPQENARFRLAKLSVDKGAHAEALSYFRQLHPLLDQMNHHSSETMLQARQVRYYTGYLLLHGKDIPQDVNEAKRFLLHAADEGEGAAAYELGMLLAGSDDETATRMFQRGRSVNHPGCIRELALLLKREKHEESDWTGQDVYELLEDAKELGDTEALVQIGLAHQHGLGTMLRGDNLEVALGYYMDAALRGHTQAAIYCGQVYHLMARFCEAAQWFAKSPENPTARMRLASYRLEGSGGLQKDEIAAFRELESIESQQDDTKLRAAVIYLIGQCYEHGQGTTQDNSAAKQRYLRAAELDNVQAMFRLGVICDEQGDQNGAFHWYSLAATTDHHAESQYRLGLYHWHAFANLDKNPVVAKKYFGKAAEQGHPSAKFELGNVLWYLEEYKNALACYSEAADLNVPEALCSLGKIYHVGFHSADIDIPQNGQKAFTYFLKAAAIPGHDGMADLMVGTYYAEGCCEHIKRDLQEALTWYLRAHHLGVSPARVSIGKLKHTMADDLTDARQADDLREEAYGWFIGAQNDISAQVMVALYHLYGWGRVPRDEVLGFQQLLAIAQEGHTEAYMDIAVCFEKGIGVDQNDQDALAYWMLASQVDEDAEVLDRVGYYHEKGLGGLSVNKNEAQKYYERANTIRKLI